MKLKILAITIFVIGAFIACKKVGENFNPIYSDLELKIDKKSAFAPEERKIKEGIMGFSALSKSDRKAIVEGIIMDNKNVAAIVNNTMPIFKKLKKDEIIQLYKIIIPNSNFTIIGGDKVIVKYNITNKPCGYWRSYYNRYYNTGYWDDCIEPGSNLCMKWIGC